MLQLLRLTFLLFFLGFVAPTTCAQSLAWSPLNSSFKGAFQSKVLAADKQGYYVYQSSGKERSIEKFSYANNLIYSHKLPLDDRNIEIEELVVEKTGVTAFFSIYSPTLKKHGLFYIFLPHQGEASTPATLFDQGQINSASRSSFKIMPRSDLSGFSLLHINENNTESLGLDIRFYDAALGVERRTSLFLPHEKTRYEIREVMHDPNHNLLLWMYVTDKDKRSADPAKFYYKMVRVNRTTLELEEANLRDSVYFLNAVQPALDELNQKIRLVGFFSEKDRTTIAGSVLASVSLAPLQIDTIGLARFDLEFKTKLQGYKNANRSKELADYYIKDIVMRSDGGALLVAESNYQTIQTYVQYSQGFPIYREIIYYHYDEIVVVSVNANGTIDWRQIIPKAQVSTQLSPYNSFVSLPTEKHLNLIFNEEGRSKNAVVMYRINNQGDVVPRIILSPETDDAAILESDAAIVGPNAMLIPATKRKKKGLFRLTFETL